MTIDVSEPASRFDEVLARAAAGDEVEVSDGAVVKAQVIPFRVMTGPGVPDLHPGAF